MIYHFHPAAEAEHYETIGFYESRSKGLGGDYLREFEAVMLRVMEAPQRFRVERKPGIRIAPFIRFPYKVVYREIEGSVQISPSHTTGVVQIIGWVGFDNGRLISCIL